MRLTVLAKPGSHRDSYEPRPDGTIVVRVRARAEAGKANAAVAAVIAEALGVPKSSVKILTPKARIKLVEVPDGSHPPRS